MLHSCQLNDCTIEIDGDENVIDGDENVIFEEDDEEDEGYLFAGQGIGKTQFLRLEKKMLNSTRMEC